ncbi:hypothetical protein PHLCEN_2v8435 [Hermanssonia centrifuga]|uniref:C2H2-type domain-containing protein n=1 Tax=Hermanssonia centrifuga TaxID=98765 RepID=A0A2R6NTU3_9APHY|nr:hypothetical protein PHLCEN_2v8435 [Hermanssonia centrifuga]
MLPPYPINRSPRSVKRDVRHTAYIPRYSTISFAMPASSPRDRRDGKENRAFNPVRLLCPSCHRVLRNLSGLTKHTHTFHARPHGHTLPTHGAAINNEPNITVQPLDDSPQHQVLKDGRLYHLVHPKMNGRPCDSQGRFLNDPTSQPSCRTESATNDWTPFASRLQFETADFLFQRARMSQGNIDRLLELWAASLIPYGALPPFAGVPHMLETIDSIPFGDAPWTSFKVRYTGDLPPNPPPWMTAEYEVSHRDPLVCVRNMLANPDFADEFDVAPYREYDPSLKRQYTNLMSGNWAWKQAVGSYSNLG